MYRSKLFLLYATMGIRHVEVLLLADDEFSSNAYRAH